LLAGAIYFLLPILLLVLYKRTIKVPPSGSDPTKAFKIIGLALKRSRYQPWKKGFWNNAKPSVLAEHGINATWSDELVEDVKRTIGQ
jgi:hypothetical protein